MKLLLILLIGLSATKADSEGDSIRQANTDFANAYTKFMPGRFNNVVFSPFSAHLSLSMLYQGSGGTTKEALAEVLHLPEPAETAKAYQTVLNDLNEDNQQINVKFANKIYVKPGASLKPEFSNVLKTYFNSEVQTLDFTQNVQAAKQINTWIQNNTNNDLYTYDLVHADDLNVDTHMVLLNTFHIKGDWLIPFDARLTTEGIFYIADNMIINIPMMRTSGKFVYKKDEEYGAEVIAMPFRNTNYSFFVILPEDRYGVDDVLEKLNAEGSIGLGQGASLTHLELTFPKFQLTEPVNLNDVLTQMGLPEIFESGKCDLTNMFTNGKDIYVSKAMQMAYLNINENGCEATAATEIVGRGRSLPRVSVKVDHQFLFAIGHQIPNKLSDVLLIGKVANPAFNEVSNYIDV